MDQAAFQDPIARLLAAHADTRRQLQALLPPAAGSMAPATAIAWFDGEAQTQRRLLEQVLCPALIESMAGSDAVCLKGLMQGVAHQGADLGHRWRQEIRATVTQAQADTGRVGHWTQDYLDYLRRADDEILPMANRLLDGTALAELAKACEAELTSPAPGDI